MIEALLERRKVEIREARLRAGIVAATIVNANPFRGEDAEVVSPAHFLGESEPETEEEKAEKFLAFVTGNGNPEK